METIAFAFCWKHFLVPQINGRVTTFLTLKFEIHFLKHIFQAYNQNSTFKT